jgi:hypothetical protein
MSTISLTSGREQREYWCDTEISLNEYQLKP